MAARAVWPHDVGCHTATIIRSSSLTARAKLGSTLVVVELCALDRLAGRADGRDSRAVYDRHPRRSSLTVRFGAVPEVRGGGDLLRGGSSVRIEGHGIVTQGALRVVAVRGSDASLGHRLRVLRDLPLGQPTGTGPFSCRWVVARLLRACVRRPLQAAACASGL